MYLPLSRVTPRTGEEEVQAMCATNPVASADGGAIPEAPGAAAPCAWAAAPVPTATTTAAAAATPARRNGSRITDLLAFTQLRAMALPKLQKPKNDRANQSWPGHDQSGNAS